MVKLREKWGVRTYKERYVWRPCGSVGPMEADILLNPPPRRLSSVEQGWRTAILTDWPLLYLFKPSRRRYKTIESAVWLFMLKHRLRINTRICMFAHAHKTSPIQTIMAPRETSETECKTTFEMLSVKTQKGVLLSRNCIVYISFGWFSMGVRSSHDAPWDVVKWSGKSD